MLNRQLIHRGVLAMDYAMDFVFADTHNYTYDYIYECISCGIIPERAILWHPFADMDGAEILEIVDSLANDFIKFEEQVNDDRNRFKNRNC